MSELVDSAVKFRKEITGSTFNLDELRRIFIHTSLSDVKWGINKHASSDFGAPMGRKSEERKRYFV